MTTRPPSTLPCRHNSKGRLRVLLAGLCLLALPALAQDAPPDAGALPQGGQGAPILIVDPERLFANSDLGKQLNASLDEAALALSAENRQIEATLSQEEQALTDQRADLSPEEFRKLADAFDTRVTQLREAQAQKAQLLDQMRNQNRVQFIRQIVPILAQMMQDAGAQVMLNQSDVFLSTSAVDITDAAIARINADIAVPADDSPATDPTAAPSADRPGADPEPPSDAPALVPDPAN